MQRQISSLIKINCLQLLDTDVIYKKNLETNRITVSAGWGLHGPTSRPAIL